MPGRRHRYRFLDLDGPAADHDIPRWLVDKSTKGKRARTMPLIPEVHELRKVAGHGNITTAQRYIHPDQQSINDVGTTAHATGIECPLNLALAQPATRVSGAP